jgi:shikimate kinase
MPPDHLFLIGYRGSGKSSVGRALAAILHRAWIDTDERIAGRAGMPIRDLFAQRGEADFRSLESSIIADLALDPPAVVSLGGGAILRPENRDCLRRLGSTVWLRAPVELLSARIAADEAAGKTRPSLTGSGAADEVARVLTEREPLYASAADWTLEIEGATPDDLARRIADWYAQALRSRES